MDTITQKDTDLANFAKAIALPVRVGIIRLILERKNEATRLELHSLPYKQATVNQHLAELIYLKILKSKRDGRMNSYKVDEAVFTKMSNNFLSLLKTLDFKNDVTGKEKSETQVASVAVW